MPQILILALAGAGAYVAGRAIGRFLQSSNADRKGTAGMAKAGCEPRDLGALKKDPATGVYRPSAH